MFEHLMQLLERGVVALERIADQKSPDEMAQLVTALHKKYSVNPLEPVNDVVVYSSSAPQAEEIDEEEPAAGDEYVVDKPEEWTKEWAMQAEEIIQDPHPSERAMEEADAAHLRRESVKAALRKYNKKFKESSRTETLEKMLEECERLQECEAPPAIQATKEDVRAALVTLSAAKGKDAALQILKQVGGADKLSDITEDNYGKILEAIHASV